MANNGIIIGLSALAGVWLGWYSVPICLSVLVVVKLIERDRRIGLLLICLISAVFGSWRSVEPPVKTTHPNLPLSTGAVGRIIGFPRPSGDEHRAVLKVSEICIHDQCVPDDTVVLIYLSQQSPPPSRGQELRVSWQFDTLQQLPSGYRSYVSSQGAEGRARVADVQVTDAGPILFRWIALANDTLAQRIEVHLPGDAGALATGIVTGDDSALSDERADRFRATGTSHLTAVSGQNVSIIIGFLSLWYAPKTFRGRAIFHGFLVLSVWSFTLFVGMESPALRAAIVATLMVAGRHVGRRPDPVTLLSLTLGVLSLINPLAVHSVGFWLSAVASMALCLALPRITAQNTRTAIWEITRAPAVASIATMPIALASFGTWSPVGIIANLVLGPLMALTFPVVYGFSVVSVILPPIANTLAWIPAILLDWSLAVVDRLAPVAAQIRVDTISPFGMVMLWTPIIAGIWLLSSESDRWIRRMLIMARRHSPLK